MYDADVNVSSFLLKKSNRIEIAAITAGEQRCGMRLPHIGKVDALEDIPRVSGTHLNKLKTHSAIFWELFNVK